MNPSSDAHSIAVIVSGSWATAIVKFSLIVISMYIGMSDRLKIKRFYRRNIEKKIPKTAAVSAWTVYSKL